MKKLFGIFLASFCLLIGLALSAPAQSGKGHVIKRQKNQQTRIKNGVQNGSVTRAEFRRLENQQARTRRLVKHSASDGEVTNKERFAIHKRQDKNSRSIFRAKHNDRDQEAPQP